MRSITVKLFAIAFLVLVCPEISSAQRRLPEARSEEPAASFAVDLNLWASLKETIKDTQGNTASEFDMRLAPLTFGLAADFSESWRLEGKFLYSHLYSINNPPTTPFSPDYVGTTVEVEGSLGRHLVEGVVVRGGVTHTYLDRDVAFYQDNFVAHVETTYTSPFVGVGVDLSHLSSWIVRGYADMLFFTRVNDNYFGEGSTTTSGLTGYKAGVQIGYMFTDHIGAFGSLSAKVIDIKSGYDGQDAGRRSQWNGYGAGIQLRF